MVKNEAYANYSVWHIKDRYELWNTGHKPLDAGATMVYKGSYEECQRRLAALIQEAMKDTGQQ